MSSIIHAYQDDLLCKLDAIALAEHLKNKDFTAEELARCAIKRAEAVNPTLNAIAYVDFEQILEQAALFASLLLAVVWSVLSRVVDAMLLHTK